MLYIKTVKDDLGGGLVLKGDKYNLSNNIRNVMLIMYRQMKKVY